MATDTELKKGRYIVEPGIAISEFIEKLNKLSYEDFPEEAVTKCLLKNKVDFEFLEPYSFFSDVRYTRNLIHKSSDFELILMCWSPGQYSAIHGHEGQKCWMRIEKGALEFTNYDDHNVEGNKLLRKLTVKDGKYGFVDGPAYIHGVKNKTKENAVSLHLYAKPIPQCDIYDLEDSQVKKVQLGYHSVHGKLVAPEDKL